MIMYIRDECGVSRVKDKIRRLEAGRTLLREACAKEIDLRMRALRAHRM